MYMAKNAAINISISTSLMGLPRSTISTRRTAKQRRHPLDSAFTRP
jgi:hypothetical protein